MICFSLHSFLPSVSAFVCPLCLLNIFFLLFWSKYHNQFLTFLMFLTSSSTRFIHLLFLFFLPLFPYSPLPFFIFSSCIIFYFSSTSLISPSWSSDPQSCVRVEGDKSDLGLQFHLPLSFRPKPPLTALQAVKDRYLLWVNHKKNCIFLKQECWEATYVTYIQPY